MEESGKGFEFVAATATAFTEKRQRSTAFPDDTEDLDDDILAWISDEEAAIGELMTLLDDAETSSPQIKKVKFIDHPYSSSMIFQSSSSYVTINGNEESCGSSFSDSDSSMMASIDTGGAKIKLMEMDSEILKKWKSWSDDQLKSEEDEEEARGWMVGEECTPVSELLSWDEDDLARFIGEAEQGF